MPLDLDDERTIAITTCYGKKNFEILLHDVLQIMFLVQYIHKWSIVCITSLSINIFGQLLAAASEGVAMSVQKT